MQHMITLCGILSIESKTKNSAASRTSLVIPKCYELDLVGFSVKTSVNEAAGLWRDGLELVSVGSDRTCRGQFISGLCHSSFTVLQVRPQKQDHKDY